MSVSQACPACLSNDTHFDRQFSHKGSQYTLRLCNGCGSRYYDPIVIPDYTSHTESEAAIRDYVELNGNIDFLAGRIMQVIGNRKGGRLLDIGCGYGFSADAARRLAGWEVIGVEPSPYGRRGAAALGFKLLDEFIDENHPVASRHFDVIFASEVIEHVADPVATLRFWTSMLAEDGVLAMTTPNSACIAMADLSQSEQLSILSPGFHTVLFSKAGLERACGLGGLRDAWIQIDNTSLLATAGISKARPFDQSRSAMEIGAAYMTAVLDGGVKDKSLELGLRFRLMQNFANRGLYAEAEKYSGLLPDIRVSTKPLRTYEEFLEELPACAPALLYYRGMIALNHQSDYEQARQQFMAAAELCIQKLRLNPMGAVVEADLLTPSLFHAGLAARYAGQEALARALFSAVTEVGTPYGSKRHVDLEKRAARELATGASLVTGPILYAKGVARGFLRR